MQWVYSERPVLVAFGLKNNYNLELDKPAGASQLLQGIKQMGIAAGMPDRVYVHAVRLGSARDVVQLPAASTPGCNTGHVRQALGHSLASPSSGVTDRYVGGLQSDLYSLRAQHSARAKGSQPSFALIFIGCKSIERTEHFRTAHATFSSHLSP
jgi:hypothetical protein